MHTNLTDLENYWQDTPEVHTNIFRSYFDNVNADPELKAHRDFVEMYQFGYGDRPFHWMWKLIVDSLPDGFKFLEIGVYQGQVISLVSMLSKREQKHGSIYGITPLKNVDDAFSKHPDIDYEGRIAEIMFRFGNVEDLSIIEGLSTDPDVIRKAGGRFLSQYLNRYDVVYIDGGHDYNTVISDIEHYAPMVHVGGLLVMDDSANYLKIPDGLIRMDWRGLMDVSNAVRDRLETDARFKHIFNVGHNRVWRRLS